MLLTASFFLSVATARVKPKADVSISTTLHVLSNNLSAHLDPSLLLSFVLELRG